jgi:hypothetical protein
MPPTSRLTPATAPSNIVRIDVVAVWVSAICFMSATRKLSSSAYLLLLGVFIVLKALEMRPVKVPEPRAVAPLGLFGGALDAIGGGGWGPIVTSTLLGQGMTPRYAIGSVNLAEFFVTLTISTTFFLTVGLSLWPIITGLIIGGIIAAPFAAFATKHIPDKVLMLIVGCVVVLLSLRTLAVALAPG